MEKDIILETERTYMRKMDEDDFSALCTILQDSEVMYAYEHAFSDDEVWDWLHRQMRRYETDGVGLWLVIDKKSNTVIGQCGITMQDIGRDKPVPEIGYLFAKAYWHKGYATETAVACRRYGFDTLGFDELYSIIRDNNIPSQNAAKRNDMTARFTIVKHYHGMDMPHIVYSVKNPR